MHLVLLYGLCHSQNTAKLIIYTGNIFLREREVVLTDNNVMKPNIFQTTADGPQTLLISRFLQFEVLCKIAFLLDVTFKNFCSTKQV